jgi:hypothetical protein
MNRQKPALRLIAIAAILLGRPSVASAGMPGVTLTDIAMMRLEAISFFLLCFLVCSWIVRGIWNSARKDFPRLPHLSYKRATGLVAIWGLLFLLVLTMISGARELLTPGAWRKQGLTYTLVDEATAGESVVTEQEPERRHALVRLRVGLWTYANSHGGKLPVKPFAWEIPSEAWVVPGRTGMRYRYNPGLTVGRGSVPVAYEPGIFDGEQFVLLSSGKIVAMSPERLSQALLQRQE